MVLPLDYEITPDAIRIKLGEDEYATLEYHVEGGRIFLDSTYTPHRHRGKGVGGRLMSAAIEYARSNHHSIVPVCPFAIEYFKKHPEYGEVVEKGV